MASLSCSTRTDGVGSRSGSGTMCVEVALVWDADEQ